MKSFSIAVAKPFGGINDIQVEMNDGTSIKGGNRWPCNEIITSVPKASYGDKVDYDCRETSNPANDARRKAGFILLSIKVKADNGCEPGTTGPKDLVQVYSAL
jgi:hypothetical protein